MLIEERGGDQLEKGERGFSGDDGREGLEVEEGMRRWELMADDVTTLMVKAGE
jgi:hypothetical protein